MPKFFTEEIYEKTVRITGEDAVHISKVLRSKQGDRFTVCDGRGTDYLCSLQTAGAEVILEILEKRPCVAEPKLKLTLYQALPKLDKMEMIIQKSVELGVNRIVPVMTERCVSRPSAESMERKIKRWQKISESAAKQSERGIIPKIEPMLTFKEAVSEAKDDDNALLFYERGGEKLSHLISEGVESLSVIIGSEGGFSPEEVEYAFAKGIKTATLGPRILRCETAPLAAVSIIMNLSGNM